MNENPVPDDVKPKEDKIKRLEDLIEKTERMEPKTGRESGMKEGIIQFLKVDLERAKEKEARKKENSGLKEGKADVRTLIHALSDIPLQHPAQQPRESSRKILLLLGGLSLVAILAIAHHARKSNPADHSQETPSTEQK